MSGYDRRRLPILECRPVCGLSKCLKDGQPPAGLGCGMSVLHGELHGELHNEQNGKRLAAGWRVGYAGGGEAGVLCWCVAGGCHGKPGTGGRVAKQESGARHGEMRVHPPPSIASRVISGPLPFSAARQGGMGDHCIRILSTYMQSCSGGRYRTYSTSMVRARCARSLARPHAVIREHSVFGESFVLLSLSGWSDISRGGLDDVRPWALGSHKTCFPSVPASGGTVRSHILGRHISVRFRVLQRAG
jgi:hypothetical protein